MRRSDIVLYGSKTELPDISLYIVWKECEFHNGTLSLLLSLDMCCAVRFDKNFKMNKQTHNLRTRGLCKSYTVFLLSLSFFVCRERPKQVRDWCTNGQWETTYKKKLWPTILQQLVRKPNNKRQLTSNCQEFINYPLR